MLLEPVYQLLQHNAVFSGGALLMAAGGVAASLRRLPDHLLELVKRRTVMSLELDSQDEAFEWFKSWIDAHPAVRNGRRMVLTTLSRSDDDLPPGEMPRLLLTPAAGKHVLRHEGRWYLLTLSRERGEGDGPMRRSERQRLSLETIGGDRAAMLRLVEQAYRVARSSQAGIAIKSYKWESWDTLTVKPRRDPSSVILAEGVFEQLEADARAFVAAHAWYDEMGIPWKRGYLLYGEPGNGKSSLVLALATLLGADVYYLNLAAADVTDDSLVRMLSHVPRGHVLLLEEIDTVFDQRTSQAKDGKLTFGGLLNALDGSTAPDGLVTVMTTNHADRLDPALVRPGRIDLKLCIGNATPGQVARLFRRFFPEVGDELVERAVLVGGDRRLSMASLQGYFTRFRGDPGGAVEAIARHSNLDQAAADSQRPHYLDGWWGACRLFPAQSFRWKPWREARTGWVSRAAIISMAGIASMRVLAQSQGRLTA